MSFSTVPSFSVGKTAVVSSGLVLEQALKRTLEKTTSEQIIFFKGMGAKYRHSTRFSVASTGDRAGVLFQISIRNL